MRNVLIAGADIKINNELKEEYICKYCGSTIFIESDSLRTFKKHTVDKDDVDEKCREISQKFNEILKLYIGSKNEMLLMLKEKIGLVSSGKTVAKYTMMRESPYFVEEPFDAPFTYRIEDRTLDHFEYKRDGSIEVTYETEGDGFFAIEYYGKVLKYSDLGELSSALDEIIEEVKRKL